MKVIFETSGSAPVVQTTIRAVCFSIGVGAYTLGELHVGCYLTSTGAWGAFGLVPTPDAPHRCIGCIVKTELLALALGLEQKPRKFAQTVVVPDSFDGVRLLEKMKRENLLPSWEYSTVVGNLAREVDRLLSTTWTFNTPMQPATTARELAETLAAIITADGVDAGLSKETAGLCNMAVLATFPGDQ